MVISNELKIRDLQQEFQTIFPYLKIDFYRTGHRDGEGSSAGDAIDPETAVGEIRQKERGEVLSINPNMTIGDFEKMMHQQFGFNVQVSRKSGNLWLQTSSTDHWTLAKANQKGEHSTEHYNRKYNA